MEATRPGSSAAAAATTTTTTDMTTETTNNTASSLMKSPCVFLELQRQDQQEQDQEQDVNINVNTDINVNVNFVLNNDELLYIILDFVGWNHQYRFIGGVNKMFRNCYLNYHRNNQNKSNNNNKYYATTTSIESVVESISRCKLFCREETLKEESKLLKQRKEQEEEEKEENDKANTNGSTTTKNNNNNTKNARYSRIKKNNYRNCSHVPIMDRIGRSAARYGKLEVLQFAVQFGNCKMDWCLADNAAESGNLHVMEYVLNNGCVWDDKMYNKAALHGYLNLLQTSPRGKYGSNYDGEEDEEEEELGEDDNTNANTNNNTNDTEYTSSLTPRQRWRVRRHQRQQQQQRQRRRINNHGRLDWMTCFFAASGGHLDVLQFLRSKGFSWNHLTCSAAAGGGHLHVLQWARANGCEWNSVVCTRAVDNGHLHILQWARSGCGGGGARYTNIDNDTDTDNNDNICPWDRDMGCAIGETGNIEIFHWALENGYYPTIDDGKTCELAAQSGHFDLLQLAMRHGCICDHRACVGAAIGGHLDILKWLHETKGIPLHDRVCYYAANCGHLDILQWVVLEKCYKSWSWKNCLSIASSNRHNDVVEWLIENAANES